VHIFCCRRKFLLCLVISLTGSCHTLVPPCCLLAAPAKGNYVFPYRCMAEGDELRVGALRIVALETPGHTPEHTSWAVYEDSAADPVAVFTGGSLIVGRSLTSHNSWRQFGHSRLMMSASYVVSASEPSLPAS
jgi:glyoxylase-like metal-dependent hydrolase (beta-lactamase superfamily II)